MKITNRKVNFSLFLKRQLPLRSNVQPSLTFTGEQRSFQQRPTPPDIIGVPANKATPEGVVFVVQWLLVALVGYWLISLALRLLAAALRRTLWLLKVALAAVSFALILSDYRVGTEAMAFRLGVLVCVCVLLGVGSSGGSSGGSSAAKQTARLEQQVKVLEKRVRDMERWTKTDG